jgi:hypothetical protein
MESAIGFHSTVKMRALRSDFLGVGKGQPWVCGFVACGLFRIHEDITVLTEGASLQIIDLRYTLFRD